jgi:Arc/MetJ-type ribon-helix-helix transcriptional regulator
MRDTKYRTVGLPVGLYERIESYILRTGMYSSVSEFVKDAVRRRLEELGLTDDDHPREEICAEVTP